MEAISNIERVPRDIIDEYRIQAKLQADMDSVSSCAQWDLEATWVLSHFQITKEYVETIM